MILFADEEGAAEAAQEAGARHVANVERADAGPKILRSFFDAAQEMARHEVVCFVNCDIVLTQDFGGLQVQPGYLFMRAASTARTRLEMDYGAEADLEIILRAGIERAADVIGLGAQ